MSDLPSLRRPSDDIAELQRQLLRELAGIQKEGDAWTEPTLFRAYLQHAQALAWQRVADGDLNGPRDILDHLLSAQPFADEHSPKIQGLAVQAALEIQQVLRSLYLADQVLEEARTRNRLADRDRSRTEREVLRILLENRGTYLRRGAVRARMDPEERPTPARVGQILVGLHEEGLVLRTHGRAQGSPSAAFYALSPFGFELCRTLGLDEVSSKEVWLNQVIEKVVGLHRDDVQRRMLIASLSTCSNQEVGDLVIKTLEERIRQERSEAKVQPYKEILVAVLLARRKLDFGASTTALKAPAVEPSPGLHILKSTPAGGGVGLTENIVNAFISDLEKDMPPDIFLNVLLQERGQLSSGRAPSHV